MSSSTTLLVSGPTVSAGLDRRPLRLPAWSAWVVLLLLLAAWVPLFLRMPPWADAIQYDLEARNVLQGGMAYRDVADVNLPGMMWIHLAIRSTLGWGFVTLRLVDLGIVGAVIWLLVRRWLPADVSAAARVWIASALAAFYLSTPEICHCQRDTWLLLPTLAALAVQVQRLEASDASTRRLLLLGVLEGLLWGIAFWIKPHVLFPALASSGMVALVVARTAAHPGRRLALDAGSILLGGLLAGIPGILWLWQSGTWPYFADCCFVWTRGYSGHKPPLPEVTRQLLWRFYPWALIHVAALPLAVATVWNAGRRPTRDVRRHAAGPVLLAACYLGWFVQANFLQIPHEYVWVAPELLGLMVVASRVVRPEAQPSGRWPLVLFVAFAIALHPSLAASRLGLWTACWQQEDPEQLHDQLTLVRTNNHVRWAELEQVAAYLRGQHVGDGELTCNNPTAVALYLLLDVKPATRYLYVDAMVQYFPEQVEAVRRDLDASQQRFVVSDLDLLPEPPVFMHEKPDPKTGLPPKFPPRLKGVFPWTQPIVFRTSRYVVQRVTGPVGVLTPEGQER